MPTTTLEHRQTVQNEHLSQHELPATRKESIFSYYDVSNEINFIKGIQETVPLRDRRYIVRENVNRFLGEFAGKVPYTTIAYTRTDQGLSYAGIDLMDSYRKTAHLSGVGSREEDELIGYEKIAATMAAGATSATWISPPKIADYGFVFHFQRDPESNHIREYILRYDEQQGELGTSASIQNEVAPDRVFDIDTEYLHNPHIGFGGELDIAQVMKGVGICDKEIQSSQMFEKHVRAELSGWVNWYSDAIEAGEKETAELLLTAIFNRALDIKKAIGERPNIASSVVARLASYDDRQDRVLLSYYSKEKAEVIGGGSCPAVKNKWNGDPLAPASIADRLGMGTSINKILDEANEHFTCPECEYQATGPVGNECPNCHLTKEDFALQGGTVC